METLEKVGIVAGGGVLVAVALAVAGRSGGASPGGGATPTPTPTGTPTPTPTATPAPTVFNKCWAYYATDSGKGYVLDNLGKLHYVRDACAWYQAGYPYPVDTAAHTTEAQIQAYGAAHGTGTDVCNNNDAQCPNPANTFGCAYSARAGFQCADFTDSSSCPDPQNFGGATVYNPCPSAGSMVPMAGTPCTCAEGWGTAPGNVSQTLAQSQLADDLTAAGMVASALGRRV